MDELITELMKRVTDEAAGNENHAEGITFEPTEGFMNLEYLP